MKLIFWLIIVIFACALQVMASDGQESKPEKVAPGWIHSLF